MASFFCLLVSGFVIATVLVAYTWSHFLPVNTVKYISHTVTMRRREHQCSTSFVHTLLSCHWFLFCNCHRYPPCMQLHKAPVNADSGVCDIHVDTVKPICWYRRRLLRRLLAFPNMRFFFLIMNHFFTFFEWLLVFQTPIIITHTSGHIYLTFTLLCFCHTVHLALFKSLLHQIWKVAKGKQNFINLAAEIMTWSKL